MEPASAADRPPAPDASTAPDAEDAPDAEPIRVVDPTHVLLSRVGRVESRVPWIAIGVAVVVALWVPIFTNLATDPVRPAETRWVEDALAPPGQHSAGSAFALALTRTAWKLQGAEIRGAHLESPGGRRLVRFPFAVAGLAATLAFFVLARLMVGSPAAVLSVALLAASRPWTSAGASALPLVVGEMMVLLGVVWAMTLQGRHREVGVAGITASRVGIAGIFLGVGILLTPAAFATFVATLLIWLLVGIRRSRADATTLQVVSPARLVTITVAGSLLFLAGSLAAVYVAERIAGGTGIPALIPNAGSLRRGVKLWSELYGSLLSPGPMTDALLLASLGSIVVIRFVEWRGGRPWRTAGLAPWAFLGLWIVALARDGKSAQLDVPLTLPPLFVLGLAWLILRGLHPGQFRRQEYTFLLVWLGVGLLLVPFVPGSHPHAASLAAAVVLLPPMLLLVGRAGSVLWSSKPNAVARTGLLIYLLVPVAWSVVLAAAPRLAEQLDPRLIPAVLIGAASLGVLAEIVTVRPDPARPTAPRPSGRPGGPRRGGRRRGGSGRRRSGGGRDGARGGRGRPQTA